MSSKFRLVTPLERTLYLKTLQPMRDLSAADLAEIAADAEEKFFRRGEALYQPGEPVSCVHIITEGRVRVSSEEIGTVMIGERQPVGALTLLSRNVSGLEAVAESDVRTLMIPDHVLFDLFEDNFKILHHQIVGLARRTLEARKNIPDGTYLAPAEELDFPFHGEMDLVERILFMRRGGGFQEQNMDALIQLAMAFEEVRLEPDRTLWRSGDAAGFMYIILQGNVVCRLENGNHFRVGPGYPLGNLESQALSSRWYDAVTETPILALRARTDAFIDVLEDHFSLALDFLATLARNLLHIIGQSNRTNTDRDAAA